ncbi:MAG: FkbM family methyltransferase [Verrucomicrobiae bacterium]|nr:FkbM family methyltransferase [Verrucomicrobiae bacterium]
MVRAAGRAILDVMSEGLACVMTTMPVCERAVAACFRRAAPLPGVRRVSRHVFAALQRHAARSADSIRAVPLGRGAWMKVPLQDYCGSLYFDRSSFEPQTARFLAGRLRAGDVFVDVGASYGFYTLLAGAVLRTRGGGKVVAFEPNPSVRALLEESVRLSELEECVAVHPFALGRQDAGRARLFLGDAQNTGLSTLQPWAEHLRSGALSAERTLEVECRSLDGLLREGRIERADVMKVDVELAELEVFLGGVEFLERLRPRHIICETALGGEATAFLRERGYEATLLEPLSPHAADWGNVLFTARDANARQGQ